MGKIKCMICGREFERINYSHLKAHGITREEYCDQFPGAPLVSEELRKQVSEKLIGRTKENDKGRRIASEKMTGKIPTTAMIEGHKKAAKTMIEKIPTQAMIEGYKRGTEKRTGRTKENDEGVRKMAETLTGRIKEEYEYLRNMAEKLTGRTKETHEYLRIISEKMTGRTKENDEGMRKMSETLTGRTKENHEGVRRQSEKMKERPKESYKHLNRTGLTKENDESVRRGAEKLKERWENPTLAMIEERRKTGEKLKGRTPENNEGRRRAVEKMTGKVPTEKMIEGHKKGGEKMTGKIPTLAMVEGRKIQGKKMKGRTKENDEGMKSMSEKLTGRTGEQCPNWKGGISFEPYCEKFDEDLKNRVREFFNRCCYVCGKNEIDNKRKLDVHHVTYNKDTCCDDSKPLFVPLCRSCHSKTRGNRKYWEEFFTISLNYLTDGKCFYSKEDNTYKNRIQK